MAATTWPGVQMPHWKPPQSMNACWTGCSRSSPARPSTVVTSWPSAKTASAMQELTILPSSSTVQAPQTPTPQPSLEPVSPRS